MHTEEYDVIGVMSGTSLDGLDVALTRFVKQPDSWSFTLIEAKTYPYGAEWESKLNNACFLTGEDLVLLHNAYGKYMGEMVTRFINETGHSARLVASHGHTVFHRPEVGLTFQLGHGASLAAACSIETVSDFRSFDVALGGQGAPLVPAGDAQLFSEYDYCLNLGGFANISHQTDSLRLACDICPVNIVTNELARRKGFQFDRNGEMGSRGKLCQEMADRLNELDFYKATPPKSLGREWVETVFMPVVDSFEVSLEDKLRSVYEHVAHQLSSYINRNARGRVLVTGGGAYNEFLLSLFRSKTNCAITIPEDRIIQYKEALIFSFLGLLRKLEQVNCYSSVTGAIRDNAGGVIHLAG